VAFDLVPICALWPSASAGGAYEVSFREKSRVKYVISERTPTRDEMSSLEKTPPRHAIRWSMRSRNLGVITFSRHVFGSNYSAAAALRGPALSSRKRGIISFAKSVIFAIVSLWSKKPPWPNINKWPKPPTLSLSALI
jgi:hypothetical protein